MDAYQVIGSIDDVYRIALWSLTPAGDRSIYLPGSRGRTWKSVEGLRIEQARGGSIQFDLTTILSTGAVTFILAKITDIVVQLIEVGGLRGVRAAASLKEAEAALKAAEARKATSDAILAESLLPLTVEEKQLALDEHRKDAVVSPPVLRANERAVLRKLDGYPISVSQMETRTSAFPHLYRLLFRGRSAKNRARDRSELVKALDDASRAIGRLEDVQARRQPMIAVFLVDDEDPATTPPVDSGSQ
jgi:hypothetical protein